MPTSSDGKLRIDKFAATYGLVRRDIEHFETVGLLTPNRDEFGRFYSSREDVRLQIILKARKLGFDDKTIAAILDRLA